MLASVELLDCVAELRKAKETPEFFMQQSNVEQAQWSQDLLDRSKFPPDDQNTPSICVLDTGVNNAHPLLKNSLPDEERLSCDPSWGSTDHQGHGTEMAGLALYGDLVSALESTDPIHLEHSLESVKLLPPPTHPPNPPELYGKRTQEAFGRIEIVQPNRNRAFCMAVTAPDNRDQGKPSSWSASVDDSCCGVKDEHPRLVIISAGNIQQAHWGEYPERNDIDSVHDPGQAWNALTVGAYTEKVVFDTKSFPGWNPIAPMRGLSPSSTTSVAWEKQWPNKPDIVMEGGNGIHEPTSGSVDTDDSLQLLTTNWEPTRRVFNVTGDTSAATALASRMAAILMARYPNLWPETVRGLMIHSSQWTDEMVRSVEGLSRQKEILLGRYGYGVPNLEKACWSASNSLSLIMQDSFQPFENDKTKEMRLYDLPWPKDVLLSLSDTPVSMKLTLSYFIEPNPGRRGWKSKFRYQSHGLRFKIRTASESLDDFRARVSKDEERPARTPEDKGWLIGPKNRDKGSVHSDIWQGTAADLAVRHHIAVHPVGGWWKDNKSLGRQENSVRYALIVTLRTPDTSVDIYTPVLNQVVVPTPIALPTL
jgi:hypothetical protein